MLSYAQVVTNTEDKIYTKFETDRGYNSDCYHCLTDDDSIFDYYSSDDDSESCNDYWNTIGGLMDYFWSTIELTDGIIQFDDQIR